ncbi:HrcA family transcriptional regulator [Prochlorococcus sp. MIT 1300]|uniref:HrcA family transcriptional regulator n=1 Tax=Prochlorococcus sp. MIT 1300 TaxID=3096218 RepID=UPI002A761C85|nr:HrcA family transcriptional regulator [Prochlorococcus sp. MIT 1300]
METLPQRQQQILRATVHHYVDTIEPVSSKTLVQRFGLKVSSATVRSVMGVLEQRGLLIQPHVSAGRVPSPQGYRHYVNCLLPPPGSAAFRLERELTSLSLQWASLDDLLWQLARRLTDFTGLMSLITRPALVQPTLQKIRLVNSDDRLLVMLVDSSNHASHLNLRLPSEALIELDAIEEWLMEQLQHSRDGSIRWAALPPHLKLSGAVLREAIQSHAQAKGMAQENALFHGISRLVSQPEFSTTDSFLPLLDLMDRKPAAVVPLISNQLGGVLIGAEHPERALEGCSVVHAPYRVSDDQIGNVALVGPMRMAYSTCMAAVKTVANHLERILH